MCSARSSFNECLENDKKYIFSMASVINVYTNSCLEITVTSDSRIFFFLSFFLYGLLIASSLLIYDATSYMLVIIVCDILYLKKEVLFWKVFFVIILHWIFFFTGIFEGFDNLGTKFTRWRLLEGWYYFERTSMSLVAFVKLSVFVLGSDYELPSLMATGNSSWSN